MGDAAADKPSVVIIGGPNGAGKTTVSRRLLLDAAGVHEFVNADAIAQGLSGFEPERAAIAAGRVMLARLKDLAAARTSFAFESTLSSRTFAPWLRELKGSGYEVHLVYVSLVSASLAVRRVSARVRNGGHGIPVEVVRRRFVRSAYNLFSLYMPLATTWRVFDNSTRRVRLVAWQSAPGIVEVEDPAAFDRLRRIGDAGSNKDTEHE